MQSNPGIFNKQASDSYKAMTDEERNSLKKEAAVQMAEPMSRRDVLRRGELIFKKLQHLVSII